MFEFLTSASTTTKGSSLITTSPRLMDLAAINPVPESGMSDRRNILLCFSAIRSDAIPQLCAMFWKFCSSADVVWFGFFWTLQILKQQMQKIFYCPDGNNLFVYIPNNYIIIFISISVATFVFCKCVMCQFKKWRPNHRLTFMGQTQVRCMWMWITKSESYVTCK